MGKNVKTTKPLKLMSNTKKRTIGTLVTVCGIAAGVYLGVFINGMTTVPSIDYGNINPELLYQDEDGLMDKYNTALNSSRDFSDFTYGEIANISRLLIESESYVTSSTVGTAYPSMGGDQIIRAKSIKCGTSRFEESASKGIVSTAWRMYYTDGEITKYNGKLADINNITYTSDPDIYTTDSWVEMFGELPGDVWAYIISDATIKESDFNSFEKSTDGYTLTLELDPVLSVIKYVKQMKEISGLDDLPVFEYVKLTINLDDKLMLNSIEIDEHFSAKMIVGVQTKNDLTITYTVSENSVIPLLTDQIKY